MAKKLSDFFQNPLDAVAEWFDIGIEKVSEENGTPERKQEQTARTKPRTERGTFRKHTPVSTGSDSDGDSEDDESGDGKSDGGTEGKEEVPEKKE